MSIVVRREPCTLDGDRRQRSNVRMDFQIAPPLICSIAGLLNRAGEAAPPAETSEAQFHQAPLLTMMVSANFIERLIHPRCRVTQDLRAIAMGVLMLILS